MATATERLALLVEARTGDASKEFDNLAGSAKKTQGAADDMGRSFGLAGGTMKNALVGAGIAFAGLGLADMLKETIGAYLDGAKAAGLMATAMNATVEEAGAFSVLMQGFGLDMNDLLEIQAEFAQKAAASADELEGLGVELAKNDDGTIQWSDSIINMLETLQTIPDATERNRVAFKFFGEEGAKQLGQIFNSSRDVREALEEIGVPFTEEDVKKQQEFADAWREITMQAGAAGREIASAVVPVLTTLLGLLGPLLDFMGDLPPEVIAMGAAFLVLRGHLKGVGDDLGMMGGGLTRFREQMDVQRSLAAMNGQEIGKLNAAFSTLGAQAGAAAKGGLRAISDFLGGPLGVSMIGIGIATEVFASSMRHMEDDVKNALPELEKLEKTGKSTGEAMDQLATDLDHSASFMTRFAAEARGASTVEKVTSVVGGLAGQLASNVIPALDEGGDSAKAFREEIEKQAEAMGPAAVATAGAALAQKDLNDLIAEGTTSGEEFNAAVATGAQSQVENKAATDLSTAAINAYIAATTGAVDATLAASSSLFAQRDAYRNAQDAIAAAATAQDDAKTASDEVAAAQDGASSAALRYAAASLKAAEDQAALEGRVLSASEAADVQILALQQLAAQPGISEATKGNIQTLIDQLGTAKAKADEGVTVDVGQTGAEATGEEIEGAAEDRDSTVHVKTQGGNEAKSFLTTLVAPRTAIINVETRGGNEARRFLDDTVAARTAIINVETRGANAARALLDDLARPRTAIINVETRGLNQVAADLAELVRARTATINVSSRNAAAAAAAPVSAAAPRALGVAAVPGAAGARGGVAAVPAAGGVVVQNSYRITVDVAPNHNPAEVGRAIVQRIRSFERAAGAGWRS